jgi:hypothetical protein
MNPLTVTWAPLKYTDLGKKTLSQKYTQDLLIYFIPQILK